MSTNGMRAAIIASINTIAIAPATKDRLCAMEPNEIMINVTMTIRLSKTNLAIPVRSYSVSTIEILQATNTTKKITEIASAVIEPAHFPK